VIPAPAPAANAPAADAEKAPEAPTIAAQLSKEELAAAQQETNQSLEIAEKNLAGTQNKRLNAAQSDLVSKIKGFLKDAREAAQAGDWARARNLAKKAQVLSEELVRSA
jgi:ribosomal protein S20